MATSEVDVGVGVVVGAVGETVTCTTVVEVTGGEVSTSVTVAAGGAGAVTVTGTTEVEGGGGGPPTCGDLTVGRPATSSAATSSPVAKPASPITTAEPQLGRVNIRAPPRNAKRRYEETRVDLSSCYTLFALSVFDSTLLHPVRSCARFTIMGALRNRDFRRLWLADLVNQLGSRIDVLAVPLLATTVLGASVFEVSLLRTAESLPYLVLGLQAGAWCDRVRHRPVLIAADVGRAALIGSIPVAALFGVLGLPQLLAVVFGVGFLTMFFDIAHQTYLPRLVTREHLPDANARLATNLSMAAVAGPSAAGFIVQALGNATALAADALSYLWSALWLRRIKTPDVRPEPRERHLLREIGEGLRVVRGNPVLRAISAYYAFTSFFQSMHLAIVIVFLSREVGLAPWVIGLLSTSSLTGALAAGLTARRLGDGVGPVRAFLGGSVLFGLVYQLYPLTDRGWALACYVVAGFGASYGVIVKSVFGTSFQQAITPPELLGRVNATTRTLIYGVIPLGSLAGGGLAGLLGMRATLHVAAAGILVSVVLLVPLRKLRELPVMAS
ncbi:MAG: hypothetical protein QOI78_2142 [Actinomycetota bacterium]|nr:hypothetical protein [Actinomycetota bacterium]